MRLKFFGVGVCLLAGFSSWGGLDTTPPDGVVDSLYELKSLFVEHQYAYLPISPPSEAVFSQDYSTVVPVDWRDFPKAFTKQMYAEMNANGYPLYRIAVYEDSLTRETVFLNSYGTEVCRLAAEKNYDPYLWQKNHFLLSTSSLMDPWAKWIFDPAHIAAEFTLVPQIFYADYVLAEEQRRLDEAVTMPMMATMSLLEGDGMAISMGMDSNGFVKLDIDLPPDFGNHAEIFGTYNLVYVPWGVAANRLSSTGGTHLAWTDPASIVRETGFYIVSDADLDSDGDGYSNLRETLTTTNNPNVFDLVDEDQDGMHDWYETILFGGLGQAGTGDFDGDGIPNNQEMVYTTSGSGAPKVTITTDPSLYDTDGDGMNDGLESSYPFLDPLDPSDADYDHDGLSNWVEYQLGTTINNWDTDGDTLPDGIEVEWGTDPLFADNLESDADGDDLSLRDEYHYGSNPNLADSDGDGVDDGDEVAQGSSPSNGSDGGAAPDQADTISLTLTVGDPSNSESEIYEMVLSGERTVRLNSGSYGNVETGTFTFLKGNSYELTIRHVGSDRETPDYDYTASVVGTGIIKADPEGILGTRYTSGGDFFAEGKSATVHLPKVSFTLSQTTMTLKHDNQCALEITTEPESVVFSGHEYMIRFENETGWYSLGTGESMDWTTKVAGKFRLRAQAEIEGVQVTSGEQSATVQFPLAGEVILDSGVVSAMDLAWNLNKNGADAQGFHEFGFMINLNTANNEYEIGSITPSIKYSWDDEDTGVAVLHDKWSDPASPSPIESGVTYSVTCFHTHPPLTDAPEGFWRIVGPSSEDLTLHYSADTPGVVRDYIGVDHVVLPGHSKDDPEKLYYPLGPFQRGI